MNASGFLGIHIIRIGCSVFGFFQILGLDICADTMVGDQMHHGIYGGQKKRVTTSWIRNNSSLAPQKNCISIM
jgi:hypothetical protein